MRANARCSRRSWTPPWKKSRSSKRSLSLVCNLHNRQGTAEKERSCPGTRSLSASCVESLSLCIAYCGSMPRALEQNATMRAHPHARRFRVVAHKVSFIAFAYSNLSSSCSFRPSVTGSLSINLPSSPPPLYSLSRPVSILIQNLVLTNARAPGQAPSNNGRTCCLK